MLGMFANRGTVLAIALVSMACGAATTIATKSSDDLVRTWVDPNESGVDLQLSPGAPWEIAVADSRSIEARPVLASGAECRYCRLEWRSRDEAIVEVEPSDPPCRLGRCAVLHARDVGDVVIEIELCTSEYGECSTRVYPVLSTADP